MRLFARLLAILSLWGTSLAAQDPANIAIIDTAWDTTAYVSRLKDAGIQVVGRYYARCEHMDGKLPEKRLAFRPAEVAALKQAGMAILSIYQFHSSSKHKYDGMRLQEGKLQPLWDGNCNPAKSGRSAKDEARLDADAAVKQAQMVGQPRKTAIYFGVDYNFSQADQVTRRKLIAYFSEIRRILGRAGYQLGIYGNGDALRVLGAAGLADYRWIMASRSFHGSSAVHRSKDWHLFQAQVDRNWFKGLPVDLNIQNPAQSNAIGFWRLGQPYAVPINRTRAIFKLRRFVCNGDARLRPRAGSTQDELVSGKFSNADTRVKLPQVIGYAQALRAGVKRGNLVQVDVNDDGVFDGWTWAGNLSGDFNGKPDYRGKNKDLRCR